jgi:signal peptidase I
MLRGVSMEPTYRNRSLNLVSLRAYAREDPRRYDVVAIRTVGARAFYAKRILGVPGERIELANGTLLINGEVVPEPYLVDDGGWTLPEVVLGEDEFYVAGDNRSMPQEHHTHGVVRGANIAGEVVW